MKISLGTELIKMHPRQRTGGRSTDPSDYPSGKADYALRSVDGLRARARNKGTHVGIYAERLLGGPLPWARMRVAYALLHLCDKYGDGRVEAVCQSALAFDSSTSRASRACSGPPPNQRRPSTTTARSCSYRRRGSRDPSNISRRAPGARRRASDGSLRSPREFLPELVTALKRLKLGRILDTLPERLVLADKQDMSFDDLLLLVLTDEIAPRDSAAADHRAHDAGLDPSMRLEQWDKTTKATFDKRMLSELVSLRFLEAHRHVVVLGPTPPEGSRCSMT